jgi:hypothetical protein
MQSLSYIAGMFSLRRFSAASLLLGFVSLGGAASCLYDSSNRCDSGQRFDPGAGLCVCAGNTVAGDHGCVACGDHQIAANDACTCDADAGYTMVGAACQLSPEGLGAACQADADCTTAPYSTCQVDSGTGYCTNTACATNDDCTGGYACNTTSTPTFCQQPPTGQGMSCASDADCAGTDATYCETFTAHTCFVQGCSLTTNDCFSGYSCCDLGPLSGGLINKQICVMAGTCGVSK